VNSCRQLLTYGAVLFPVRWADVISTAARSKHARNMANDMGEDEVDEVFRGVCMALMNDDGRLKRVHDATVALEVCPRQYEASIRVVKGCRHFSASSV